MNERNTSKIITRKNKLSFGQTDRQTNKKRGMKRDCLYTIYNIHTIYREIEGEREMIHECNYKKEEKLNIGQMDRQTDRWTDGQTDGQTNSIDRKTIKVIYM